MPRPQARSTPAAARWGLYEASFRRRRSSLDRAQGETELEILEAFLNPSLGRPRTLVVGRRLLGRFGSLAGVAASDASALRQAGLSGAAAADLRRVRNLASAMARDEACRRPVLSSWTALIAYIRVALAHRSREEFRVLYLDKRNILMRDEHRAAGTTDHAPVFNAGPGRVERAGGVPPIRETEAYVVSVLDCFLARVAGRPVLSRADCRPGRAP